MNTHDERAYWRADSQPSYSEEDGFELVPLYYSLKSDKYEYESIYAFIKQISHNLDQFVISLVNTNNMMSLVQESISSLNVNEG